MEGSTSERFYITTAIDYPNADPHIGHAYEKIVTDAYARWSRMKGRKTLFLTGLDEHGQKIQDAAIASGQEPQVFVDRKAEVFRQFCRKLAISNDDFIRTTEERHVKVSQELFRRAVATGDIYKGAYEGQYCVHCEAYYTETQIVDGKCPEHGLPTEILKEESYFFRLGKYRDWIRDHIQRHPGFIVPETRRNEILARLGDEVHDLSVSRCTFDWGVPLPNDPSHVIYVWFDALTNYVTAVWEPEEKWRTFWPADVHVIGKDIIWFHTVIWPCILRSAGIEPPRRVYVHGHILDRDGRKMSKTLGNVVEPLRLVEAYGVDVVRYYFLRAVSSGGDGNFSEEALVERYNSELGNDLGNLLLRIEKLVHTHFGGSLDPAGYPCQLDLAPVVEEMDRSMERMEHHRAVEALWGAVNRTNAYLNEKAPWREKDRQVLGTVLYNALEAVRFLGILLGPFMPGTGDRILSGLGVVNDGIRGLVFGSGRFRVAKTKPLFPRMERRVEDPFALLDLRVGRITAIEDVPGADKLYRMTVDIGDEKRTAVAGMRPYVSIDEMRDRRIVFLVNLKPRRIRGIDSHGMLLAAQVGDVVLPLDPPQDEPGTPVGVEGIGRAPAPVLEFETFMEVGKGLSTRGGKATYRDRVVGTAGGPVTCPIGDGAAIR